LPYEPKYKTQTHSSKMTSTLILIKFIKNTIAIYRGTQPILLIFQSKIILIAPNTAPSPH